MTQHSGPARPDTVTIAGHSVRRIGLGAMQFTGPGGMGEPTDPAAVLALLRTAVDAGVNLIDTSGYYGPGVANRLIARALQPYPEDFLIATKVGARRTRDGSFAADESPAALRAAVEDNLAELGLESLPLVHLRHMPDAGIPLDESVGVLSDLRDKGLIQHIGVSNVSTEQLAAALAVADIASVQNEFRLGHAADDDVLAQTTRLGIPYLAFRPLGNGALPSDSSALSVFARQAGASPAALALAWVLDQGDNIAVIPGTSSQQHLRDNLGAQDIDLTPELRVALAALGEG